MTVNVLRELKTCLREPIPEIAEAAKMLNDAATSHLAGDYGEAARLIRLSDLPKVRSWTESLRGANSEYIDYVPIPNAPPRIPSTDRVPVRMPNASESTELHARDGFHCRFCGIPVIRKDVRVFLNERYPDALPWGRTNLSQHAAFQAMWLQYDHLLAHARGGTNDLENIVITCAPCNYGRGDMLLEEVGLVDPMTRSPMTSKWDGLERLLAAK